MSRIAVTGGYGFIGSHLVDQLVRHDHEVVVVDNLSNGNIQNLDLQKSNVELHFGDLLNSDVLLEAFRNADAVVHLAATGSVTRSIEDPIPGAYNNVVGTVKVLDACRQVGVHKVVYASSCGVYGTASTPPFKETYPTKPPSPYLASKLAGEVYCQTFRECYGISPTILRFTNVYGSRRSRGAQKGVTISMMEAIKRRKDIVVYGDGEQVRDLVHVFDIVQACELALKNPRESGVFNIGTGQRTTINKLAEILLTLTGSSCKVVHLPARKGELQESVADISKAKSRLGYAPAMQLGEGLTEFVKWYDGLKVRA